MRYLGTESHHSQPPLAIQRAVHHLWPRARTGHGGPVQACCPPHSPSTTATPCRRLRTHLPDDKEDQPVDRARGLGCCGVGAGIAVLRCTLWPPAGHAATAVSLLLTLEGVATALPSWFAFNGDFDSRFALGTACLAAADHHLGCGSGRHPRLRRMAASHREPRACGRDRGARTASRDRHAPDVPALGERNARIASLHTETMPKPDCNPKPVFRAGPVGIRQNSQPSLSRNWADACRDLARTHHYCCAASGCAVAGPAGER